MPFVAVSGCLHKFYAFHRSIVRPYIVAQCEVDESALRERSFLLHTRRGTPLSPREVTQSFKMFITSIVDGGLGRCTITDVRKSYATRMIVKHRRGELEPELSRQQFLEFLGDMMNTSASMLESVYCANQSDDELCTRLASFFAKSSLQKDGESVSGVRCIPNSASGKERGSRPIARRSRKGKWAEKGGSTKRNLESEFRDQDGSNRAHRHVSFPKSSSVSNLRDYELFDEEHMFVDSLDDGDEQYELADED